MQAEAVSRLGSIQALEPMRPFYLLALAAFAFFASTGCSRAAPGCGKHSVYGTTDEKGRKIELVLDSTALQRGPSWSPGTGVEPPLSVAKASRFALAWAKAKYTRYDSVEIREIVLASYSCSISQDRWYYRIEFSPIIDGNRVFGMGNFAAVLMDGSVVGPTASR